MEKKSKNEIPKNRWELTKYKIANVNTYKGQKLLDIREFFLNKQNELLPTKKGISLSKDLWEKLKELIPLIDKAFDEQIQN